MTAAKPLRRILVATDFSPGAAAAVDRAVQLAGAHGAALDLLHVFDIGAWHSLERVFDARRLAIDPPPDVATRQRLIDTAAALTAQSGVAVEAHFGVGRAADRVVAHARERACALIVLGARGEPGWLGLGGTAAKVLRVPGCPVLMVRLPATRPYERVLLGVDLRAGSLKAAQFALRLLPDAHHHAMYALDPALDRGLWTGGMGQGHIRLLRESMQEQARKGLDELAAGLSPQARHALSTEIVDDARSRAIVQRAASLPADCVVVGHHGEDGPAERWLGNMAQHVLQHTACDVLVVP